MEERHVGERLTTLYIPHCSFLLYIGRKTATRYILTLWPIGPGGKSRVSRHISERLHPSGRLIKKTK
jgi:hypothetical protein